MKLGFGIFQLHYLDLAEFAVVTARLGFAMMSSRTSCFAVGGYLSELNLRL